MPEILLDAGPLIALLSRSDRYHAECSAIFRRLDCPFLTTLPVITEAMYFLHVYGGAHGQEALWKLILRSDILLEHPTSSDLARMDALMRNYSDPPMDFADASLVAIAERLSISRVFTLDPGDFTVYKLHGRAASTLVGPE